VTVQSAMTVQDKFRNRLSEGCNTPHQLKASRRVARTICKVLGISPRSTVLTCRKTKLRAKKIFAALGVAANRQEGVHDAIQACAGRNEYWERTVAQLIVDMVGQGDDIRLRFPRTLKLAEPCTSRLAPSLVKADEARRQAVRQRIDEMNALTRIDCDKCGASNSVNIRVAKKGKKGGAGGKAADVAHYECIVCARKWCDTNE
jgi:hypothetical protein